LFCRSLKNQLVNMNLEVFHRYRMEVLMGAGRAADSLCGIAESYAQALEVVSYNRMTGSTDKLFYEELPQEQNMYYYPIELENSLITAISGGKAVEASKILNTIYEENFVRRSLSGARISELIGEVYSSLNKVRQTYFKDEERMSYRLSDFTIRGFFEYARDFVFAACENMKVYEENAHNAQFKKMLEYINENYSRNDLSRDTLASAFGLTDITYISKMFKRFMNENFSSYLERIRIEKACDLLDSHRPVKEVAEAVGYLSDISFRRAFKKRMGMSPSEYISRPGPAGGTGSGPQKTNSILK
ncbi:MAG: helix-turn-helix domain-containing protein, partial [Clostridia bacterium]